MRKAMDRLGEFYKTQLGQDILETGVGAVVSAGGQLLFTDMTPEQIAASTALGIGAATVGRPVVGRTGQIIGTQIDKNPTTRKFSQELLNDLNKFYGQGAMKTALDAKLSPYAHLSPSAQLGQLFGRGYGDNLAQGVVALAAPGLVNTEEV